MVVRHLAGNLVAALDDTPIVLLNGARQTGKSTLAQALAAQRPEATYLTLDDYAVLGAARADPLAFLEARPGLTVIDEVQRAPELFLALKAAVDRDRRPGHFLLTGSANVLLLPRLAETLVGRMEILTLEPFSQGELAGVREGFLPALFSDRFTPGSVPALAATDLVSRVCAGGYPEAVRRPPARRRAWFESYLTTLLQRDLRDLSQVHALEELPRLLALVAARAGGLLNTAELSRSSGLPATSLSRYLALLQATFLLDRLPAWSANLGKRLVRSPKLYLNDTGVLVHLLGGEEHPALAASPVWGRLLECFVLGELRKQITWAERRPRLYHFRTHAGQEVDFLLEQPSGELVGLEVKASSSVRAEDFKGLRALAEQAGERFHRGVVLYTGSASVPFGPQLWAVPLPALWA